MAPSSMAAVACAALAGVRSASAFQPSSLSLTAATPASPSLAQGNAPSVPKAAAATGASFSVPLVMSAVLLGAAATAATRRRNKAAAGGRAARVVRNLTVEQINNLTIDDVPDSFRMKCSLGMARRHELKEAIKNKLEETFFILAWNRDCMSTAQTNEARAMFPGSVTVRALKNSLVRKAMIGTAWEEMAPNLRGNNMYVFVHEDTDLKPAIEAYLKVEKKFRRKDKVAQMNETFGYNFQMKPLLGGMLRDEFNFIDGEEVPKFKDFPTRLELIARIAGGIKQVTQKVAVGINQVPKKLAVGTKKIVEKMEDEGKASVADVVA